MWFAIYGSSVLVFVVVFVSVLIARADRRYMPAMHGYYTYQVRKIWREAAAHADKTGDDAIGRFLSNVGHEIASGRLPPGIMAELELDNLSQRIAEAMDA